MLTPLFWLTAGLAVADWAVVSHRRQIRLANRAHWLTKPAVLLALIAWFTSLGGWQGPLIPFGLGLVFSLFGDVLLLLPEKFFLSGAGAFLLAHICYIFGFLNGADLPVTDLVLPLLPVALAFLLFSRQLRAGLMQKDQSGMIVPVMVYALALSLMWSAALSTLLNPAWQANTAGLATLGGTLFFASDTVLAFHRFVRPIRGSELLVMITYHSGQVLLTGAALLHFL